MLKNCVCFKVGRSGRLGRNSGLLKVRIGQFVTFAQQPFRAGRLSFSIRVARLVCMIRSPQSIEVISHMNETTVLRTRLFFAVMAAVLLMVMSKLAWASQDLFEKVAEQGNDDIMRLLSVRDWLAGQGWYDMAQYRALPPDGISLHWSRYIDVGIAALIVPLSWFMPMAMAEVWAAFIWPTVIMVLTLLVIGFGTRRLFGVYAACFALVCFVLWPVTGDLHSGAGNLDHHNVQMLAMALMALAAVWPDRLPLAGSIGGFAAAFSLAVGLETLPFVMMIGGVILVRAVLVGTSQVRRLLLTFCLSLGVSSVVLWLGQAAPASRLAPICDQLGTPTIALIWIAVVASLAPLSLGGALRGPVAHLGVTVILTGMGLFTAWSLVSPCLAGPYANLPVDLQAFISGRITEAKPGLAYAQIRPAAFVEFVLPVFTATLAGFVIWLVSNGDGRDNTAVLGLLFLCVAGIGMVFVQMRTVIMAATVVPIVAGYVFGQLLQGYLASRDPIRAVLILVIGTAVISPGLLTPVLKPFMSTRGDSALAQTADCRTHEALIALNAAPPGLILNHFNFGPSLLWATHHNVLSIGYHRSAAGMRNSIVPFELEADEMEAYVKASGATYLLLCRGYNYRGAPARALADGGSVDWLRPVVIPSDDQLLFEVLR